MVKNGVLQREIYEKMLEAREFFFKCLGAQAEYVAVENPLPMARARLPQPSCFVCPSWFGVKYTKKTLYWLKNLPPVMAELEAQSSRKSMCAARGESTEAERFPNWPQA